MLNHGKFFFFQKCPRREQISGEIRGFGQKTIFLEYKARTAGGGLFTRIKSTKMSHFYRKCLLRMLENATVIFDFYPAQDAFR